MLKQVSHIRQSLFRIRDHYNKTGNLFTYIGNWLKY